MLTIVWDVDDVLNAFTREWFERVWQPAHPEGSLAYTDLRANPPHEILGASLEEYHASIDRFRASTEGRQLPPVAEVAHWFAEHGHRFRHVALTARPLASAGFAADWVCTHFGRWIRAFGFVPSARGRETVQYDSTKAGWLEWVRCGDIFVDDNPSNLAEVAALGLSTLVVPQPWNGGVGTIHDVLDQITAR